MTNTVDQVQDFSLLQDKVKRQPLLYKPEFLSVLATFHPLYQTLRDEPAKPAMQACKVLIFLANVSHHFKNDLLFLKTEIVTTLEQYYAVLHHDTLFSFVKALITLRQKEELPAQVVIPLLIKLSKSENKKVRELLEPTIIGDLKKIKKGPHNQQTNSQLQTFMIDLVQNSYDQAAKLSLKLLIESYRKNLWKDQKVVNGISYGCLSKNKKICRMACSFFLITNYRPDDDVDDEDQDTKKNEINKLLTSKLPKKKKAELKATLKSLERKSNRRNVNTSQTDFFPIDLLYDPQSFADKLFHKVKSSSERFEIKALMICLTARLIGRHKLVITNFYPFIQKYIHPKQIELPKMLAALCEACHDRVPPDDIKAVTSKVIENFVNESGNPENITMGLNTIREMCIRMPYAIDEKQLSYLVDFRSFKNKSVTAAARSLINSFRDIYPNLLQPKLRGLSKPEEGHGFGEITINQNVEGINLIDETGDITKEQILDDSDLKKIKLLTAKEEARKMGKMKGKDIQKIIGETMDELKDKLLGKRPNSDSDISNSDGLEGEEQENSEDAVESDITDSNMDEKSVISEEPIDNEQPEEDEPESDNQGFIDEGVINTFKKTRRQKFMDEQLEEKEKYVHHRKEKTGSTTNKEKLKSKPFMMTLPKRKDNMKKAYKPIKERIHDSKKGKKVREGKIMVHKKVKVR